jgi:hypothetical protein
MQAPPFGELLKRLRVDGRPIATPSHSCRMHSRLSLRIARCRIPPPNEAASACRVRLAHTHTTAAHPARRRETGQ